MSAYASGDRRAFSSLFAKWGPRLHGFLTRGLGDPAAADDVLQVTFLKIHRARASFKPLLRLRTWLYSIAVRELREELRRRRHTPLASPDMQEREQADASPDVQRSLEMRHRASAVREALARLPEAQRMVVHMHRYEEMSFAEIAQALGMTEGAVKQRAFRAYETLRAELVHLLDEERAA